MTTVQRISRKPRFGGLRQPSSNTDNSLYELGLDSWKIIDERRILHSVLVFPSLTSFCRQSNQQHVYDPITYSPPKHPYDLSSISPVYPRHPAQISVPSSPFLSSF